MRLKPQIITKDYFIDNPELDDDGYIAAYAESMECDIGWVIISKKYIGARSDVRYWTGKPTQEEKQETPWGRCSNCGLCKEI